MAVNGDVDCASTAVLSIGDSDETGCKSTQGHSVLTVLCSSFTSLHFAPWIVNPRTDILFSSRQALQLSHGLLFCSMHQRCALFLSVSHRRFNGPF